MASHVLFLQLLPVLLLVHSVIGLQNVPKELAGEGVGNKAGVQARLSQKGVNYIASFLKDVLIEQVLGPSPKNNEEIQVQLNGTKSRLTDLVLTIQSGPGPLRTRTEPPRQALVELPAITFETKAKLELETGNGQIRFRVPEATLWLNVSAQQHAQGSPNFRIEKCHLRIEERKSLIVSVEAASLESDKRASMEKELIGAGPALLEQLICSRVVFILDERVNQRFALLPSKLSLAQLNGTFIVDELLRRVGARRQRRADGVSSESSAASAGATGPDSELFASFNVSRSDSLLLDYTIVDIRADHRGIEVDSSGEVSLRGRGGTPFGPVRLALPELASEDQMLQMLVSDFMPNSLLYHGHSVGLFNARVDPGTPHFGPIMRTSCPPSSGLLFCLGDFFPTLRRVHPDRGLALLFSTVQPPVLRFRPQSAGGISFSLLGRIVISLLPPGSSHQQQHGHPSAETEVAQMQLSVDAHMKIRLSSTAVRPKVTLDKIALKTLSPGVLAQEELDKSVLLAREVLQRMVNDMLRGGIPIPVHPLLRLHKPRVKIMDRALLLLTNVEFNERLIRHITSAGLDKRTSR